MTQSTNNSGNARDASRARRKALSQSGKGAISKQPTKVESQQSFTAPAAVAAPQAGAYQTAVRKDASGKDASKARRLAMSSRGKAGIVSADRTREGAMVKKPSNVPAPVADTSAGCGCGCNGAKTECQATISDAKHEAFAASSADAIKGMRKQSIKMSAGRAASYARREAMSKRGKAGVGAKGLSAAQTARATNPNLSSRELAKTLREQRSSKGRCGDKQSEPCGRVRPNSKKNSAADDASWKVGVSETTQGQTLTGTMVGRSMSVTGDEPSTCRDVTGTEYLGADVFREFCQSEPMQSVKKVSVTTTSHGNSVSGNKIGRGDNVTGNEAGGCKSVTGDEYMSSNEADKFCGAQFSSAPRKVSVVETNKGKVMTGSNVGRSEKVTGDEPGSGRLLTGSQYMQAEESFAPSKVGVSKTLRGGSVSGTMVDRLEAVTGSEAGSCKNVTGDEYLGQEQFKSYCDNVPKPTDAKVEVSSTDRGNAVTGVMASRSELVTGNEPGTCKAVTGTPYASADQTKSFCEAAEVKKVEARNPIKRTFVGSVISGSQPAVGGIATGDSKGVCEPVSGTPYVGVDHLAQACANVAPEVAATETLSSDFPQTIAAASGSSVMSQPAPAVAAPSAPAVQVLDNSPVTGSSNYDKGNITGPFGMATGKVTGTEQARFGVGSVAVPEVAMPAISPDPEVRVKPRISGEGMDIAAKITGDDWDRGDNITGTEGTSAIQRNPTYHANNAKAAQSVSVMQMTKRNEDVPVPVSKVTGSSGNTSDGSLVTYSGGARG